MKSEIVLGLCLIGLVGCAARAQVVPIQEQVLVLREDGCKGPEDLRDYLLVAKAELDEVAAVLMWCQEQKFLPEMKPVEVLFVPETITCPNIPNATLNEYLALIGKGDFVYVMEQLEECAVNYEERERQRIKDEHSANRL